MAAGRRSTRRATEQSRTCASAKSLLPYRQGRSREAPLESGELLDFAHHVALVVYSNGRSGGMPHSRHAHWMDAPAAATVSAPAGFGGFCRRKASSVSARPGSSSIGREPAQPYVTSWTGRLNASRRRRSRYSNRSAWSSRCSPPPDTRDNGRRCRSFRRPTPQRRPPPHTMTSYC
jgi:hypothetical protein